MPSARQIEFQPVLKPSTGVIVLQSVPADAMPPIISSTATPATTQSSRAS